MRWSVLEDEPPIIGFSNGHEDQVVSNVYTNTAEAFTKLDRIKGNTGQFIIPIKTTFVVIVFCVFFKRPHPARAPPISPWKQIATEC